MRGEERKKEQSPALCRKETAAGLCPSSIHIRVRQRARFVGVKSFANTPCSALAVHIAVIDSLSKTPFSTIKSFHLRQKQQQAMGESRLLVEGGIRSLERRQKFQIFFCCDQRISIISDTFRHKKCSDGFSKYCSESLISW